jgi:hypothetical protein
MSHFVDYLPYWSRIAFALCIKRSPSIGTFLTYSECRPTYCITCHKISPKINCRLQQWKKRQQLPWKHSNKRRCPVTFILTDVENKPNIPDKDFRSCIQRTPLAEMRYMFGRVDVTGSNGSRQTADCLLSRLAENKGYLVLLLNDTISNV